QVLPRPPNVFGGSRNSMPMVLDGENNHCCYRLLKLYNRDHSQECLKLYGQATKRIWWMPWRQQAMKDVVACDKPRGAGKQALIRGSLNGATHGIRAVSCSEYIAAGSKPGELKHLSTRRNRNQPRFR